MSLQKKKKPEKDNARLAFIRTLPCVVCGGYSEPHHLRTHWNCGAGQKPDDRFSIPLCRVHHRQLHDVGMSSFFFAHDINLWEQLAKINYEEE